MKTVNIKQKLIDIDIELDNIVLGDFDRIGEFTAKKVRDPNDPLYSSVGAFYRPQYERGILIYSLIRSFKMRSMFEIGTGRGYATFCAAKAFHDMGIKGTIVTIDVESKVDLFNNLKNVFPIEWFTMIHQLTGTSKRWLSLDNPDRIQKKFDLVYIDGAHDHESTKFDIESTHQLCSVAMLMDDYHLPTKVDPGIQCAKAIDEFSWETNGFNEPECVISDRRIFVDDRKFPDEAIDYGQALAVRKERGAP